MTNYLPLFVNDETSVEQLVELMIGNSTRLLIYIFHCDLQIIIAKEHLRQISNNLFISNAFLCTPLQKDR